VPTYRLETFGKLALSGGSSSGVSHQRRRLALLALLAASGKRGLSRDQLLGYLWSESLAANAKHALEQLLHTMRRTLGESVFSGTNPLSLDAEVVESDVVEFERALARGAVAEAVAIYAGPFLNGFYLEDAPEFERWMTTERGRLATRYVEALGRLAYDAEVAGDHTAAVRWRRLLADAEPVSSRAALGLMRALVAAGDRTAALQHARIYEALVRQELESEPDPSVAKYAATLRAGRSEAANVSMSPPLIASVAMSPEPALSAADEMVPDKTITGQKTIGYSTAHRRSYWLPGGIFLGAAILVLAVLAATRREKSSALDPNKIVIMPFRTAGVDSSVKYLGEGVADLMAPMMTGEGGPVAVDSRTAISTWNRITTGRDGTADDARRVARELGAGLALTGSLVQVGGRLTITGNVIGRSDSRPLASVSAPIDSVNRLLDQFVAQILARQSGVAETSVSAITSQSLPAIRAYLNGRAAYRRAEEDNAIESFARALDIDSTFALAALDLAVATGKLVSAQICRNNACRVYSVVPGFATSEQRDDLFNRAVRLADLYRFKLGRRDLPLLDALRGQHYPRGRSARETFSGLTRAAGAAPDRPEIRYLLGTLLLYQGQALGLTDSRARAEASFREASRLDSSYLGPLARMVDVAAFMGDTARLRRAGHLYLSRDSTGATADYVRWLIAAGTRDVASQQKARSGFPSLNRATLEQIYLTSQMSGLGLNDADSAATLIAEIASDDLEKSVALRRAHLLALNRGRPAAATRLLRRMDALRTSNVSFQQFAMAAAMFNDGDMALADSAARDLARTIARDTLRQLPTDAVRRTSAAVVIESLWYLAAGDTVRAAEGSDWLRRHAEGQSRNRVLFVLPAMLIGSRTRSPEGAALRARVDSIALDGCCELPEFVGVLLARAYEAAGDEASALRVVRRGVWGYPPRLLSTYLREEGRLAARLGDNAGAIRAYEHYLALRSNPEPVLSAERDSIRAEVSRLKRGR
jgi:DNA-binding SARP family transcriptional activator/TolB-like protein